MPRPQLSSHGLEDCPLCLFEESEAHTLLRQQGLLEGPRKGTTYRVDTDNMTINE